MAYGRAAQVAELVRGARDVELALSDLVRAAERSGDPAVRAEVAAYLKGHAEELAEFLRGLKSRMNTRSDHMTLKTV